MRRVVGISVVLPVMLLLGAAPVAAADLTGGCTLTVRSFDADGNQLDEASAPGVGGSHEDPLDVAWNGRVDYEFSAGGSAFQNHEWAIYMAGVPVPVLSGAGASVDEDRTGFVTIGVDLEDAPRP